MERSVARVAVDLPLANLDRAFDYAVPASLDQEAQPGARVKVRFAGRLRDGFILERAEPGERSGLHIVCIMYAGMKTIAPEADAGFDLAAEYEAATSLFEARQGA